MSALEEITKFKSHPYEWIVEELRSHQTYLEKNMFSCRACYCHGKLLLVLASGKEKEWNGLLIPTSREFHQAILDDYPSLSPHPVLGKWLYLSAKDENFEELATEIAELAYKNDDRLGVLPTEKKRKPKKKK